MAAVVLLSLLLLSLSLSVAALLRRGRGRGPQWGALHLLHPQGALHLSRLARRHGPLLRLRMGGRGEWGGGAPQNGPALRTPQTSLLLRDPPNPQPCPFPPA